MAAKEIFYNNNTFHIAYNMIDNNANRYIVFLHGWGSNKELMSLAFKDSFCQYNHIYIDLPGFGTSTNEVVLTTYDYANIISLFLQACKIDKKAILVGHSFGGKIALLLDSEIILLSSAGILLPKSLKIKFKIALAKILKRFPVHINSLRANDAKDLSPVMYEVFKHVVREDFSLHYRDFKHKAAIFWGREDTATPLQAYNIICNLMPRAKTHVLEGDHYFFLKQGALIDALYHGHA